MNYIARTLLTTVGGWQAVVSIRMRAEKASKYDAARLWADQMGKPLLVVGGPYGSLISGQLFGMKAHDYGDT